MWFSLSLTERAYVYGIVHACMGTTTISLKDEAYQQLAAEKREGESFSDVVMRLTGGQRTVDELEELAGGLDAELAEAVEKSTETVRKDLEPESSA